VRLTNRASAAGARSAGAHAPAPSTLPARRTNATVPYLAAPASCRRWLGGAARITLYDMKTAALTIRLDPELQRQLARLARRTGRSRSELARDALRRQLALTQFADIRRRILPFAEARGYLTDEDVFRDVS